MISSAGAASASGTHAWGQLITWRLRALVRSSIVSRTLLVAFAIALGLLWIGAAVAILRELIGWWAALEYAGLTSTTPWPQW